MQLLEWKVVPATPKVAAGTIAIAATNSGKVAHDLVIVRSDAAPGSLARVGDVADESKLDIVGRFAEFKSGEKEKRFDLPKGRYLLICNVATHYELGMVAEMLVQ